jgi:hypothetical protein
MTTTVFDSNAGIIATDSRWSSQRGRWLFYVDDTNFHKIEVFKSIAFMFAGDGWLIHLWKEWIRTSPQDRSGQPPVNGITLSGIDISTKQVGFSEGVSILRANAIFAGSGARYALPMLGRKSKCDAVSGNS